ncbi:MAG TPA: amino acid permease [Candidatus Aminicenantes bacterium]|nr:amino acid permease [Candidatus Aminicenantes bacterium]HRY65067.1 amino acid permease [Candidatus Aminicenantes bacterium]HRZ71980.1 amino acid permease [Candidatus Aminicenantes bacterium]
MDQNTPVCAPVDKTKIALPRILSLWDVVMIVVGGVIGSGIFLSPSEIAAAVPSPLLMLAVWIVGGMFSFFGAVAFAELGAAMPEAGGIYIYLREAYGPLLSFLFGWTLFLVIDSGSIATLAVAFSHNILPRFVGMSPLAMKIVAAAFVVFLGAVNYVGLRWGSKLQNWTTYLKTGAIGIIVVGVFFFAKSHGNVRNFVEPSPGPFNFGLLGAFGVGLVASLWAYKGWEAATYSAGEVKNPKRDLPLGILIGTVAVIVLYVLANLAYLYVMPVGQIAASEGRVALDAMQTIGGPFLASLITFLILFSMLGAANQNMLCSPRVYFAMARDGMFFRKIAECHPKFLTPHVAIMAITFWSIVLTLTGTFKQLFTYVIFGEWIFFGLTVFAVIVLRKKRPDLERPYKTWGYPVTPILFVLAAVYVAVGSLLGSFKNAMFGLLIICLGIPAYLYWKAKLDKAAGPAA